jgi:putative ABC transport system permease protein
VGNAISSFLAARLRTIATLKCLGARAAGLLDLFLQLAALRLGVAIGSVIGAGLPFSPSR